MGVTFESNRPNAPETVTEVLVQPIAHRRRTVLGDKYASAGFVAFDGEPFAVPLIPRATACAYRFVRASAGEETALAPLGVVEVSLSGTAG